MPSVAPFIPGSQPHDSLHVVMDDGLVDKDLDDPSSDRLVPRAFHLVPLPPWPKWREKE